MSLTLYTFGYLHGRAERIFVELGALRIPCVDIRYAPTSQRWQYAQETLLARTDIIYCHIKELGNESYKEALAGNFTEDAIKIHDLGAGLAELNLILHEHGKAAIFCACSGHQHCHRRVVAEEAKKRFGVEVVHLPVARRKAA